MQVGVAYVLFSHDHVPVAITTKVDATNSVILLFPFERRLLWTNPSHKSKASSVNRQDQPLKVLNLSKYSIYIYVCIYFLLPAPICPFERYASFSPGTIKFTFIWQMFPPCCLFSFGSRELLARLFQPCLLALFVLFYFILIFYFDVAVPIHLFTIVKSCFVTVMPWCPLRSFSSMRTLSGGKSYYQDLICEGEEVG